MTPPVTQVRERLLAIGDLARVLGRGKLLQQFAETRAGGDAELPRQLVSPQQRLRGASAARQSSASTSIPRARRR